MRRIITTLVALSTVPVVATAAPAADAAQVRTTPAQRAAAADVAVAKRGAPYHWGSAGPRRFDCSGLVDFAFRRAGRTLGVRTSQQMWRLGRHVSRSALRRGDLVYTWDRRAGHVGLYLGNGRYVHAPGRGRRVEIAPLPARGAGYYGAVRP